MIGLHSGSKRKRMRGREHLWRTEGEREGEMGRRRERAREGERAYHRQHDIAGPMFPKLSPGNAIHSESRMVFLDMEVNTEAKQNDKGPVLEFNLEFLTRSSCSTHLN